MTKCRESGQVSTVNIASLLGVNSSYTRYRVLLEGVTTTMLTMYTVKYDSRESLQVVFLRLNIIRCCNVVALSSFKTLGFQPWFSHFAVTSQNVIGNYFLSSNTAAEYHSIVILPYCQHFAGGNSCSRKCADMSKVLKRSRIIYIVWAAQIHPFGTLNLIIDIFSALPPVNATLHNCTPIAEITRLILHRHCH